MNQTDKKIIEMIANQGWLNASQIAHLMSEIQNNKKNIPIIEFLRARGLLSEKKLQILENYLKQHTQANARNNSTMTLEERIRIEPGQGNKNISKAAEEFNADSFIGKVMGNCLIKKKLGQGGMGAVFLGVHQILEQTRAIKILPPHYARKKDLAERFIQEAKMAAKLEHQNIVQVYDVGKEEIYLFIVMQHIDGGSLTKLLHNTNRLDVTLALHIVEQIAQGLASAHKEGIIHRDIKPDNILLTRDGEVKIADFGLAKDVSINLENTGAGEIFGSPAYMSPEQCAGTEIDARSDLYSLGITMYQMLTGQRPFVGSTALAVLLMHQSEDPKPPRELIATIPKGVEDIILKLMNKNPDDRYQSAKELLKDLENQKRIIEANKTVSIVQKSYDSELLGALAIKNGFMSPEQVKIILQIQKQKKIQGSTNVQFGQVAIDEGYLSQTMLDKLIQIQTNLRKIHSLSIKPNENVQQYLRRIAPIIEAQKQNEVFRINILEDKAAHHIPELQDKINMLIQEGEEIKAISVIDNFISEFNGTSIAMEMIEQRQLIAESASESLTLEGQEYIQKSMLDDAITSLNIAIQLSPDNAMAYNHRGIVFVRRNELKKSLYNFTKAIDLDGTQAIFYLNRGNVQRRMQKLADAYDDYTKALTLDKNLDKAYCNRGGILLSWKRYDEALLDFESALEINSRNEEAFNGRGKIFLKQGNIQQALIEFDRLCSLAPRNAHAFNSRGEVLSIKGFGDWAKKDFVRACELDPNYPDPYYNLSIIYAKHLDVTKAVELLRIAFKNGFNKFKRFRAEPAFKLVQAAPEFQNLLKSLHLSWKNDS